MIKGLVEFMFQGLGYRVQGSGVQGLWFGVQG